jgi:predicted RND superfamily exporter protein
VISPVDALPPVDLARLQLRILLAGAAGEDPALMRSIETARGVIERGGYHPSDLPPLLRAQFVSTDGEWVALHVIPAGNIWDAETAEIFAEEVSSVSPAATGLPMHVHAHLTWIRDGFSRAAVAAALVIFFAAFLAFRRFTDAVLTTVPSILGFVWMLGLLAWLGVPLDPANIVALPLILGISIDASVHLMHRVHESSRGDATINDVVGETGSAVALASLTTMGGFASLMLADYGAMKSLGLAMTVGIGCSLLASVLVLPSLLLVLGRLRSEADQPERSPSPS